MKTLKILAFLCVMLSFATNDVKAQALVVKGNTWYWDTYWVGLNGSSYQTTESHTVITPSGNFLTKITFKLNVNDPLVPAKGVNKLWLPLYYWNWDLGIFYYAVDTEVIITSNGNCQMQYLVNGSGYVKPTNK
jgi:hypothetical protein